jgi:WbqC-like protein family
MAKTVAIVQSNYIPWKGYFDLINQVDEFVLYDDRQYTRRDWRNRNRIKTASGPVWLTIPVQVKGRYHQRIDETLVSDPEWRGRHWQTLQHSYGKAPFFAAVRDRLEPLYRESGETRLSAVNRAFLEALCELLGIETTLSWSTDYDVDASDRVERLLALCRAAGATHYVSGPSARGYLEPGEHRCEEAGIGVSYADYSGYPEYPQLHPPFEHAVSVVDLLVNTGPDATRYMLTFDAVRDRV